MAGENDVFSVLGKVEVDLAALRASLGAAEAEIQKSVGRQKKSFEELSTAIAQSFFKTQQAGGKGKGTWWSDPNMAFNLNKAGEGAEKAANGIGRMAAASGKSVGNMRSLSQAVNLLTPGLGGMTSSILQSIRFLGPWGAALIGAAYLVRTYMASVEAAATRNYEFKRSLETMDMGRVTAQLDALNEEFAKSRDLADRAQQKITGLASWTDRYVSSFKMGMKEIKALITGEDPFGGKAAADAGAKFAEAYKKIEVPKQVREFKKQMNALDQEGIKWWLSYADTAPKIVNGYNALHDSLREGLALRKEEIEDEFKKMMVGKDAATQKLMTAEQNRRILVEEMKVADTIGRSQEDQKRKLADLTTAKVDSANKIVAENERVEQSAIKLKVTEIQVGESISKMADEMAGRVTSGASSITAVYAAQEDAARRSEATAERVFKAQSENLKSLIAQNIDTEKNKRGLAELEAKRESDAAENRDKLLESSARKAEALAGEAKRFYEAELGRVTTTQEAYFNARKAFGEETIQGEITFQQALNNLYVKGTADWYNGMAKVAALQKQMRDEARGTFQSIAGEAADSLKKKFPGRSAFTAKELQDEQSVIKKADEKRFSEFGVGRAVDTDALMRGLGRQGGFERFEAQGGSLKDLFQKAITPGQTAAGAGVFTPGEDFSNLMQASADLFSTGVSDFQAAVQAFASAAKQGTGTTFAPSEVSKQAVLSSNIGRTGEMEAKRGPAPQETLQ